MSIANFLTSLQRFFNDIVGSVIPGGILIFGLLGLGYFDGLQSLIDGAGASALLLWIITAFISGHVIAEINRQADTLLGVHLVKFCRWIWAHFVPSQDKNYQSVSGEELFSATVAHHAFGGQQGDASDGAEPPALPLRTNLRSLRAIALSMNDSGAALSNRFRFLQLLCSGTGTALLILFVLAMRSYSQDMADDQQVSLAAFQSWFLILVVAPLLHLRASMFKNSADAVGFEAALGGLIAKKGNVKEAFSGVVGSALVDAIRAETALKNSSGDHS